MCIKRTEIYKHWVINEMDLFKPQAKLELNRNLIKNKFINLDVNRNKWLLYLIILVN
jgi:hypothetical protein